MAAEAQDTFLSSIADNVAESFFDGGASSNNVLAVEPAKNPDVPAPVEPPKNTLGGIKKPFENVTADDLLGELLDPEHQIPAKKVQEDKVDAPVVEPAKVQPKSEGDFNFLVESGVLNGFEDDAPIKTKEDLQKLIKGNKELWETDAKTEALKDFTDDLPEEVKFIVDYAKRGGGDLTSVFKILSQSREIRNYDVEKPEDQRAIIRNYYSAQGWSESEIEDEILGLAESPEELKGKASKLKPKLDKIRQEELDAKEQERQEVEETQNRARQFFVKNLVDTLKPAKLGDLKLSKEEQKDIYSALVEERYNSLGGVTNRLGALLDKIQYVTPNYELLAKVTMYLSDPKGFEEKLRSQINTEVTGQQIKKIKVEQQKQKIGSAHNPEKDNKALPKLNLGFVNPFE